MANEMAVFTDYIGELTSATQSFCSMQAETKEEKKVLFNAMNSPDGRVSDLINKVIRVRDIYCETVVLTEKNDAGKPMTDENGVVKERTMPRIVLITDDGKSYQCVSVGIYSAVKKLIMLFGPPTWEEPIELEIKQVKKGKLQMLTLNLA